MKGLIVWQNIPTSTEYYIVDGDLAQLALDACGQFIGLSDETEAVEKLCGELFNQKMIDPVFPLAINDLDFVVSCGIIM